MSIFSCNIVAFLAESLERYAIFDFTLLTGSLITYDRLCFGQTFRCERISFFLRLALYPAKRIFYILNVKSLLRG